MDDTLARLRQQIREIEGGPVQQVRAAPSGLPGLDGLTGGLPCPGLVEVDGPVGGGRTRPARIDSISAAMVLPSYGRSP